MRTSTAKETTKSRYKYRSFVAWDKNEQKLAAAQKLGINVSELINETLNGSLDTVLNSKIKQLQKELAGMVRDTGFEPVTPTVSKLCSGGIGFAVRLNAQPLQNAQYVPAARHGGANQKQSAVAIERNPFRRDAFKRHRGRSVGKADRKPARDLRQITLPLPDQICSGT